MIKTLTYYKEKGFDIHVVLKNRRFYNGAIIRIEDSFFILKDKKLGEMLIPFAEIYLVETFSAVTTTQLQNKNI